MSAVLKPTMQEPKIGGLTLEEQERGRKLGQEANAINGKERRGLWHKFALRAVIDNYDAGQYLFRDGLVRCIHADCVVYGLKGKGGGNIQVSTISRWLTGEVEEQIRLEAIYQIIERSRSGWRSSELKT